MEKPKNIMQMVEHLLPGGAERMAVNISNLLVDHNFNVILCPTRAKGALESEVKKEVIIECLNKNNFFDIKAFIKLYSIVKKNRIQIIHAHSSSIFWASLLKIILPKLKIVWHDHYGFSENLKDSDRFLIRYISFLFSGIIAVNEKLQQWSQRNCYVANDKIVLLRNFPQSNTFKILEKNKELKIVMLANLRPQKDHITFIKALAEIKKVILEKNVKIIFAGLFWNDDYYKSIKELIEVHNLYKYVEFKGSVNEVMSLLVSCDIGILSSKSEGLPVALLEYGLASLPVIVTDVGQCAEVVDFGKAGIVVSKSDVNQLASAVKKLILDKNLRAELGANLKDRVTNTYGANNFINTYYNLINNL